MNLEKVKEEVVEGETKLIASSPFGPEAKIWRSAGLLIRRMVVQIRPGSLGPGAIRWSKRRTFNSGLIVGSIPTRSFPPVKERQGALPGGLQYPAGGKDRMEMSRRLVT